MEKQIASNKLKTWLLFGGLILVFALIGGVIIYVWQSWAVGLTVIIGGSVYVIYNYLTAVRKIVKFSGAQVAKKSTHRRLYLLVENMSISLGIAMPTVYVIDSPALNAFAAGYNPHKAIVGVTSGLLQHLDKQELEGVIAHEMSHIVNHDTKISTLVFAILLGIAFMLDMSYLMHFGSSGRNRGSGGVNILIIVALAVLVALLVIAGRLLQAAISRRREYLADHTGAHITRYPEGLAAALSKIQAVGSQLDLAKRESALAHLFLDSPVDPKKRSFLGLNFQTHPPIEGQDCQAGGLETCRPLTKEP